MNMALVRAVRVWASEKRSEWAGERGSGRKDECLLGAFLCHEEGAYDAELYL